MKSIVPIRLSVNIDQAGSPADAILQYRIQEDGNTPAKVYTVSVMAAVAAQINDVLTSAVTSAKTSEGI